MISWCLVWLSITISTNAFRLPTRHGLGIRSDSPNILPLSSPVSSLGRKIGSRSTNLHSSVTDDVLLDGTVTMFDTDLQDSIRKWFLLNENRRAEVYLSPSTTTGTVLGDMWRAILLSVRVMHDAAEIPLYNSVHAFPNYKVKSPTEEDLAFFQEAARQAETYLTQSSPIFQPNFQRSLSFTYMPTSEGGAGMLLFSVTTRRIKIDIANFDDFEDYVPKIDDPIETNDIDSFPFPSVYDFISEINRPPDPFTMSELKFKFVPKDLKFDLEKMKKKKNPQEVVDGINCKLTRLDKWRKVLQSGYAEMPDPNTDLAAWSEKVRMKYKSLRVTARFDPKKTMETQYDKRATFIKIIDMWSDRLKRNFKYIYQSQRVPEDFTAPIMRSQWRNEVVNTTRLLSQAPFLDFEGPAFEPGVTQPLFRDDRVVLWEAGYSVEMVMYEMLEWFNQVHAVKSYATEMGSEVPSNSPLSPWYFGHIEQHTYSRGFITERVFMDMWLGLNRWISSNNNHPSTSSDNNSDNVVINDGSYDVMSQPFDADSLLLELRTNGEKLLADKRSDDNNNMNTDHSTEYLRSLQQLNSFSRELSVTFQKPVKDAFRDLNSDGKDLNEWWTTTIRDLNKVDAMEKLAAERTVPWSQVMAETVTSAMSQEGAIEDSGINARHSAADAERNNDLWTRRFESTMKKAESLSSMLPWTSEKPLSFSPRAISRLADKNPNLASETVHVQFKPASQFNSLTSETNAKTKSFLFVMPRYFRGIGLDEELVR